MGILGKLFGNSSVVEKAVDGVIRGADALFFTEEEESKANLMMLEAKIDFYKASQGSRLARRVIAFMICGAWLALIFGGVIAETLGKSDLSAHIYTVSTETLQTPVSLVVSFYFATSLLGAARK